MQEFNFDIAIQQDSVKFTPAKVEFSDYELILNQAEELNNLLHHVEITEDNVKLGKKLVAEVRKKVDQLDRQRIDGKKFILQEFDDFEKQIKEIKSVVQEGDNIVRSKIRTLEEAEREKKLVQVKALWEERAPQYEFTDWLTFDKWFEDKYLNKSQSLNKTEEALVEWLERIRSDIQVIDAHDDREQLMVLYKNNGQSLSTTLLEWTNHQKEVANMATQRRVEDEDDVEEEIEEFKLTLKCSQFTFDRVCQWLERKGIEYIG